MVVRSYDNRHRADQAARTRIAVLAAAGERFVVDGYASTTIRDIADAAGVSPETVYKGFGSKAEVLRCWIEALTAGAEEVPVVEQQWVRQVRAIPDRRRRLELAVRATAEIHGRVAAAMNVLAAAAHADGRARALWDELREQRRSDVRAIVALVVSPGSDDQSPSGELVDAVEALTEPHTHHVLVHERGWAREQYVAWLTEVLWFHIGPEDDQPPKWQPSRERSHP